jgi:hypothetical protein
LIRSKKRITDKQNNFTITEIYEFEQRSTNSCQCNLQKSCSFWKSVELGSFLQANALWFFSKFNKTARRRDESTTESCAHLATSL